jgi:translocation and assembly module TamB
MKKQLLIVTATVLSILLMWLWLQHATVSRAILLLLALGGVVYWLWRKRSVILWSIFGVLVALPSFAWWYFFHTSAGVEFLLARIDGLKSIAISVEGVTGTLSGPLRIQRFEIDQTYVHVMIDSIELQPTPAALWAGSLRASSLHVGRVTVRVKENNQPAGAKPMRFLPSWLWISVGQARIDAAQIQLPSGTSIDATQIAVEEGVSLTAGRIRAEGVSLTTPQGSIAGEATLSAGRPIGLDGHALASFKTKDLVWQIDGTVDGDIEKFGIDAKLLAPSLAHFNGRFARSAGSWTLNGDLDSEHFDLSPWLPKPPFTLQQASLRVEATPAGIHASGGVLVPEVDSRPLAVDARGSYANRVLTIEQASLALLQSDTRVAGGARIRLTGEKPIVEAQVQWQNFRWPLRADSAKDYFVISPKGSGQLSGSLPFKVQVDADVQLQQLAGTLSATGAISGSAVTAERFDIQFLRGQAQGSAQLAWGSRAWNIEIQGSQLDANLFDGRLPSAVTVRGKASGRGFDSKALFDAQFDELRGQLQSGATRTELRARGGIGKDRDGWHAKSFSGELGPNRVALNGRFGKQNDLAWQVDLPKPELLIPQLTGAIASTGSVHGEKSVPQFRGQLTAKTVSYGKWSIESITANADVDVTRQAESSLQLDAQNVAYGEAVLDTLHVEGNGNDARHQVSLRATMPAESYERPPVIDVSAQGRYDKRAWTGTVAALKFSDHYGRTPMLEVADGVASLSPAAAQLQRWCVIWTDRKACVDGTWSKDRGWNVALSSDEFELNLFDTLLGDKTQMEGRWQVNGTLTGTSAQDWTGDAHLRISDASVLYAAVEDAQERVRVGTGQFDLEANKGEVSASLELTTPTTTRVNATLRLARTGSDLVTAPLKGTLRARTEDANVLPLFFVDLDRAAGALQLDLAAAGTLANPLISGRVQLDRGELDFYRYNLALRDFGLTADIADNSVRFTGGGQLGEGRLALEGNMAWREQRPKGEVSIRGENLLVADLPEYRVIASPDLKFTVDGTRIDATGDVLIPSAKLQPADLSGAVQRSADARLVGDLPEDPQSQYQVHSEINVRLGEDVQLNTFGLQGRLTGSVTTVTHPGEPARGRGELRVVSGNYKAYGQDLSIERGRLQFEAATIDNPGLDILATRRIEEESQTVGVNVRGTLRDPRLSFYSEPSLSQSQVVSYLLTGRPLEDLSTQDTATVGSATDALAVQGGSLLASQIGSRIGLEQFSVESRGLNDTSVVLGKFLSPRLFVSYGISLTESLNTFKARYRLSDRWSLKAESGQYQSADVEFRVER